MNESAEVLSRATGDGSREQLTECGVIETSWCHAIAAPDNLRLCIPNTRAERTTTRIDEFNAFAVFGRLTKYFDFGRISPGMSA